MKERPILFSGAMVRALLDGTKTQTRRIVKPQPAPGQGMVNAAYCGDRNLWLRDGACDESDPAKQWRCPYGQPGDRLWVRETFRGCRAYEVQGYKPSDWGNKPIWFEADGTPPGSPGSWATKARPSIHMPRWVSRILLEITDVRVERLQDITDADALAEGVDRTNTSIPGYAKERFNRLWESINGAESWRANPWVWVVELKVLEGKA